ncbi:hypothetical protein FIL88_16465, partial [Aliiroseovarius halocynthiae]
MMKNNYPKGFRHMRGLLAIAAFVALTFTAFAEEDEGPDPSVITNGRQAPLSVPNNVGTDGAFSYSVPIKIPAFRGLEPNLSLNYNSQNKSRGGAEDTIGRGWSLGGLSTIERVSVGNGAPTYQNGKDIFLLDGVELLGCRGSGATNPMLQGYPDKYMTNTPSASCKSGGKFVAMRDQGLKIHRAGNDQDRTTHFLVYRPDGTRLKYESVGALAGAKKNGDPTYIRVAWRRKWVLTEIRDTQATPNVVEITYLPGSEATAFTPRVKSINYAGYSTSFSYVDVSGSHPVLKFATGTGNMGWQQNRLKSIVVKNWNDNIRAYRLTHTTSALTRSHLLASVTEFGSDFIKDGAHITGGSSLPRWTFDYTGDDHKFHWKPVNANFHTSMSVIDRNGDGRDELIFLKYSKATNPSYTLPNRRIVFATDRTVVANVGTSLPPVYSNSSGSRSFAGWSRRDNSTGAFTFITSSGGSGSAEGIRDNHVNLRQISTVPNSGRFLIGNFAGDPETEVIWKNNFYNLDDSKLVRAPNHSYRLFEGMAEPLRIARETWTADVDGDGYDEIIQEERIWDHREGGFVSYAIDERAFDGYRLNRGEVRFGDVNGDGKADLIVHDRRNKDRIGVSLSTGVGFKIVDWSWGGHLGIDFDSKGYGGARSTLADINGDGLADLVVQRGHAKSDGVPGAPKGSMKPQRGHIFLSTGERFRKTTKGTGFNSFFGFGDFDGDGRLDVVFRDTSRNDRRSTIAFNASGLHSTLKTVTEPDGEVINVSYKPSSHFGVSEIPGVRQLVSRITRKNGADGNAPRVTTYEYAGGKFQHNLRKSLGYATITAILPKIPGEDVNPRLVTEYAQNNWGVKGNITRQRLYHSDVIQRETVNTWSLVGGKRPYRSFKTSSKESTLWGDDLISKRTEYEYNQWGSPTIIRHFGLNGTDDDADNFMTKFVYTPNLNKYIVNKPRWKMFGNTHDIASGDASKWLSAEWYTFDGSADRTDAPTYGNVTRVETWAGGDVADRRIQAELDYDAYGNVVLERDAKGNETTHTYDANKHLFRTSSANAKSQIVQTLWDAGCQAPLTTTDPNGLVTAVSHDVHCREVRRDLP